MAFSQTRWGQPTWHAAKLDPHAHFQSIHHTQDAGGRPIASRSPTRSPLRAGSLLPNLGPFQLAMQGGGLRPRQRTEMFRYALGLGLALHLTLPKHKRLVPADAPLANNPQVPWFSTEELEFPLTSEVRSRLKCGNDCLTRYA